MSLLDFDGDFSLYGGFVFSGAGEGGPSPEPPATPAESIVPSDVELRPEPRVIEPAISVQPEAAS